ncbi:MAG: GldG family protein [Deltaproteobacteria bacterium]|nr:GldG family protein [Deltaproteobacteria bacterium]
MRPGRYSFLPILAAVLLCFGIVGAVIARSFGQWLVLVHLIGAAAVFCVWGIHWFFSGSQPKACWSSWLIETNVGFRSFLLMAQCALFLGFVVCGNWLARHYDVRWDLTSSGEFSLAQQSRQLLENLKQPVRLVAVGAPATIKRSGIGQLLRLYQRHNSELVSTEFVDARVNPHYVEQELQMKPGDLLYLEYGRGAEKKTVRLNRVDEETLTGALVRLVKGDVRKVYYIQGHDEPEIYGQEDENLSAFMAALQEEFFSVEGIGLANREKLPQDAALLILASPKKNLSAYEQELLVDYVRQGGALLMLYDPLTVKAIPEIAASFGVEIKNGVVLDQMRRAHTAPETGWQIITNVYAKHPITRHFSVRDFSAFMIAAPLRASQAPDREMECVEFVLSGPQSWGETQLKLLFGRQAEAAFDSEKDFAGPLALGVACEGGQLKASQDRPDHALAPLPSTSRLVVFGDSDWLKNVNFNLYGNRDLIMNAVNWLAREESGISMRAAGKRFSAAVVSERVFSMVLGLSFLVPELILLIGLFICWKRRRIES